MRRQQGFPTRKQPQLYYFFLPLHSRRTPSLPYPWLRFASLALPARFIPTAPFSYGGWRRRGSGCSGRHAAALIVVRTLVMPHFTLSMVRINMGRFCWFLCAKPRTRVSSVVVQRTISLVLLRSSTAEVPLHLPPPLLFFTTHYRGHSARPSRISYRALYKTLIIAPRARTARARRIKINKAYGKNNRGD